MKLSREIKDILVLIAKYIYAPIVLITLLPVAAVFDYVQNFIRAICDGKNYSPLKHRQKVEIIQDQVNAWNRNGRKGLMCTGRPGWKTINIRSWGKKNMCKIHIDLEQIVEIDTKNRFVIVEPGVMMGKLTSTLIPLGWTVPVVPEIEQLTVGGLVCGAGLETSSHKYGIFTDTCIEYEVVLPGGSRVVCNKDNNPDLYHSISMSHGTLGFVTAVKIPLIPAKRFVKIEYKVVKSVDEAKTLLNTREPDFVEGILYNMKKIVIMYGSMMNEIGPGSTGSIRTFSKWNDPWFYKYIENKTNGSIDYIPLRDYYHRHQRPLFWLAEYLAPYGNHPFYRNLFGWTYSISHHYFKYILSIGGIDKLILESAFIQDIVLPVDIIEKFIEQSHREYNIYPLWLCPLWAVNHPGILQLEESEEEAEMYIDIGVYGYISDSRKTIKELTRSLEKFALENKGFQALYADTFLSESEFKKMFNMKLYNAVRRKYSCEGAFPNIYDKITMAKKETGRQ